MTLVHDDVWTCSCGAANSPRLICPRCDELHPAEKALVSGATPLYMECRLCRWVLATRVRRRRRRRAAR